MSNLIEAKLKISGPRPNIPKILSKMFISNFKIDECDGFILLTVYAASAAGLKETVRRLAAKRERPGTHVEILEMKQW